MVELVIESDTVRAVGSVTVAESVYVQPVLSVIKQVYVQAESPVIVALVP